MKLLLILYFMSGVCFGQRDFDLLEAKLMGECQKLGVVYKVSSAGSGADKVSVFITQNKACYIIKLSSGDIMEGAFKGVSVSNVYNILNSNDELFRPHTEHDEEQFSRCVGGYSLTLSKGNQSVRYWHPVVMYVLELRKDLDVNLEKEMINVVRIWYELRKNIAYFRNEEQLIDLSVSFDDYIIEWKKQLEELK